MRRWALAGATTLLLFPIAACSGDDPGDASELSQAAADGEYGSHVAIYEKWYAGPTRGDLADDSELIDAALDEAREVIDREAAKGFNNGEVVGEPRAAFAVDTEFGSVVYAIGHINYDIDRESYTASGVPLPFAVVVILDDQGDVAVVRTETPISQAESATSPPEGPFALAAYADPAGEQLLVLDTGSEPSVRVGIRRSADPETGPIAVTTPWRRTDVAATGYAVLDTGGTVPYTASVRAKRGPESGSVTGPSLYPRYFGGLNACCVDRAITGGEAPLSRKAARQLMREAVGDRASSSMFGFTYGFGTHQARLPDGGIAVVGEVHTVQVTAARLGDGSLVASRCVNPAAMKSFVCHVPETRAWLVGTDRPRLEVRSDGGDWRAATRLMGTAMALVDGRSPQMRAQVKGEWVTVNLEQAYGLTS